MDKEMSYRPAYANSHALVIGINTYTHCSRLEFARQDAEAMAAILESKFGFLHENVTVLLDENATRESIRAAYLKYTTDSTVTIDDRILVFFAGHGFTKRGARGEVGYLVPVDGNPAEPTTLMRWDELTRDADLIPAKHIFFLMDACYGGLAFVRQPTFGSMRFLRDMLQRNARQVLTAGKADEVVADGNGVRPGHSIFTAHLLNALEGAAATAEGVITASGVMAYVFEHVGKDQYSHQTPHYGFIDGDGDFVFDPSLLQSIGGLSADEEGQATKEKDVLINTSAPVASVPLEETPVVEQMKELLSDPSKKIKLNDFIARHIRKYLDEVDLRNFPVQGTAATKEEFIERVQRYESACKDLQSIAVLLAQWGTTDQLPLLEKLLVRIAEADRGTSGFVLWIKLAWYPVHLIMYSAGIAALSAQNYRALRIVLETQVRVSADQSQVQPLVLPVFSALSDIYEQFKWLPGHEKNYAPRSEYLLKTLQPGLEDLLFVGRRYEMLFDAFEVFVALSFASNYAGLWGPPGRFAWKNRGFGTDNPYGNLVSEGKKEGGNWGPIKAGFFDSDYERFTEVAEAYKEKLDKMGWF